MACLKSIYFKKSPHMRIKIWKTCIGMTAYPHVLHFEKEVTVNFPEKIAEMLEAAYQKGLTDKERQIGNQLRDLQITFNKLTNL